MPVPLVPALAALAAVLMYTTLVWVLSLYLRDSGIMDVFWGPGFLVAGGSVWILAPGWEVRSQFILGLTALWAFRLAVHIALRNRGKPEDARYAAWRHEAGAAWWWRSWFKVFLLQGIILWVVSAPVQALVSAPQPESLTGWEWVGAVVFLSGFAFESAADWQLFRFRQAPSNRGRVLDSGLWRYSRHPNYFGECVVWVGVSLMAMGIPGGGMTLAGPALMIWLIVRVSGVRMLDRLLVDTKPAYRDYILRTSALVPWPPRTTSP